MHVATATAVEPANDGVSLAILVRHALRRCEIVAMRRAALAASGRRLVPPIVRVVVRGMVVAAMLFVVASLLAPKIYCQSKVDVTAIKLKKYAYEAYPSWSLAGPDRRCPGSLHELDAYMDSDDDHDAWGHPLEFRCGPGTRGLWVRSAGEDGTFDTEDDLDSAL